MCGLLTVLCSLNAQNDRMVTGLLTFPRSYGFIGEGIAELNTMIRSFDLNEDTQDGMSITEHEYAQLIDMWNTLTDREKVEAISNPANELHRTLGLVILHSLYNGESWDELRETLMEYNASELSLTKSTFRCPVTLSAARNDLADILHDERLLFLDESVIIHDDFYRILDERRGYGAVNRIQRWVHLIESYRNKPEMQQVIAVNNFFNETIEPLNEIPGCDYWQSLIETLIRGTADCEDYSIGKYVSLRLLGIPSDRLAVGALQNLNSTTGHAVVFYYPQGRIKIDNPYILDNLLLERVKLSNYPILRFTLYKRFYDVQMIYSINETHLFVFDNSVKLSGLDSLVRLAEMSFNTATTSLKLEN
jgi:predicted transglutaminase-like cysteine proteinase